MDRPTHLAAEDVVDELVLLNARKAFEPLRCYFGAEMVAAAGQVLHAHLGARQGNLDAPLQVVRTRHAGFHDSGGVSGGPREQRASPLRSDEAILFVVVEITDIAAEKVRDFLNGQEAGDVGLRVGVRGGGCSGFQYALALDEQRDDDHVFEAQGIRVIVDPASLRYVDGSTVDYTESFQGQGFEVQNPNVVASCGCGSSFRIADDEPSCGAPA